MTGWLDDFRLRHRLIPDLPKPVEKVVDKVLSYHPKPKSKAAKKRVRKARKLK